MRLQVEYRGDRSSGYDIVSSVCIVQQRLHEQLADSERIASKSTGSAEQQKDALVKAAAGQDALVVLDGVSFVVSNLQFFIFVVSIFFLFSSL